MYIINRLIGVLTYSIICVMICMIIPRKKKINSILNFGIFMFAILGYFYIPMVGADLYRINDAFVLYSNMSIQDIFSAMISNSSPVAVLYYYVVGKLGNIHFLPAITALITYYFCFLIIKKCKTNMALNKYISVALFFFFSRGLLIATISNIRTMLSLSIIAYCIYEIIIDDKRSFKYLILMSVASLIHIAGMFASILFFIFLILKKTENRKKIVNFIKISIIALLFYKFGLSFIQSAIDKGLSYLEYSKNDSGYFYIWELILSLINIFVVFYLSNLAIKYFNNSLDKNKKLYVSFMRFLSITTIFLFLMEFNIGQRISWLLTILAMPLIIIVLSNEEIELRKRKKLMSSLIIISTIVLTIACIRGDLCSYRFF